MATTTKITAPALAEDLGVDPKTLRRFIRATNKYKVDEEAGRYLFTKRQADSIRKQFEKDRVLESAGKE